MERQLEILKHRLEKGNTLIIKGQLVKELLWQSLSYKLTKNIFVANKKLLKMERVSHSAVAKGINAFYKYFDKELTTRKSIFISHHCISAIHALIRKKSLCAFVFFRSSDIDKLETDLYVVCRELGKVKAHYGLNNIILNILIGSAHTIVRR